MKNKFMIQSAMIDIKSTDKKDPKIQNGFWQHAKGKKEIKIHSDILKIRVIEKIEQKRSISKPESINDAQSDNQSSMNYSETSRLTFSDPILLQGHMDTVTEVMNDSESKEQIPLDLDSSFENRKSEINA